MAKIKVTIEEVISQTFEINVDDVENPYDEIRKKYKNEDIILYEPCVTQVSAGVHDENDEIMDFVDLHI